MCRYLLNYLVMDELKLLTNTRKYTRKLVTETYNKRSTFSALDTVAKNVLRAELSDHLSNLKECNQKIQNLKCSNSEDESWVTGELEMCESYFSKIRECFSHIDSVSTNVTSQFESARSLLKSPTAPLPEFKSREGEDLLKFFQEFEDVISKFNYSEYDKFLLLKQQISGRASILLSSLESDKKGYSHAKDLLTTALASKDSQIFNVIKQLSELKMRYDCDAFEYISHMRNITETVNRLQLNTESFLRYFFWHGLNDSFRNHLTLISNSSRPSLNQINTLFFEAAERYQNSQKVYKKRQSKSESNNKFISKGSLSLASNVSYKEDKPSFKQCTLCTRIDEKEAAHPLYKCNKFADNKSRVEKLKTLNGCTRCGSLGHKDPLCNFQFKMKCRFCNRWHFSYLCVSQSTKVKTGKKDSSSQEATLQTSSKVALLDVLKIQFDNELTILPTFSCKINGQIIRALKDGGSQSNFIDENLANELKLKVVKNRVELKLNGINTSKNYCSKVVEVNVKFGETMKTVHALCMPSLDISLELPGLGKIVGEFKSKNYNLADEFLNEREDKISQLQFILGSKSGYHMPGSDILFGKNSNSIYTLTPSGVILTGEVSSLLENLEFLPIHRERKNRENRTERVEFLPKLNSFSSVTREIEEANSKADFKILNEKGEIIESELENAADEILNHSYKYYVNYDDTCYEEENSEINTQLVQYCLDNTYSNEEGRFVMPLLWNSKFCHLLGTNFKLAKLILKSNLKRLKKNPIKLKLMDETIKEQEKMGIVARIDNLDQFLSENPSHSFLPHMGVFKMDRETTKCRVVFLSNLCEVDPKRTNAISHNQAIHSGPNLNKKLSTALLHLRFDTKILCFDICKAFNQIALSEIDSNRLLFLWYANVSKENFSIVGYKNVRLSFGLRCSPTLLMLALYKMLILDIVEGDAKLAEMKKIIYSLCYMDNCAISYNTAKELRWAYERIPNIFSKAGFELQQFTTNDHSLQETINKEFKVETPIQVKLLGMQWDRDKDLLSTNILKLDNEAKTKRQILSSIAKQFDLFGFNAPILNRSRLFLHGLQCDKEIGWDDRLSADLIREWKNIVKQVNSTPEIPVKRFVGKRGGTFKLIAFCDSSKFIFGTVIYIVDIESNECSFLMAKNRIVNKQLENKSIPTLELQSISLATETIMDVYSELTGSACVNPIQISEMEIFSDSFVALSWLDACSNKLAKMQKRSVLVMNRLQHIINLCEQFPIKFSFVSGTQNPADAVTRCMSYRRLVQTNFYRGLDPKNKDADNVLNADILTFTIPPPIIQEVVSETYNLTSCQQNLKPGGQNQGYLVLPNRYSSFRQVISVYKVFIQFVNWIKARAKEKNPHKFSHIQVSDKSPLLEAYKVLIKQDQQKHFPEVFDYFNKKDRNLKGLPNIVGQLNVYLDQEGLLRIHGKMGRLKIKKDFNFPLLMSKNSDLTYLIVMDVHKMLNHGGCYSVLMELRKKFYIPNYFSTVKKSLKSCVSCRRFKERTIKLTQNHYKDWRVDPPKIPFRYIFMDFIGPFYVKLNNLKTKVYLLCVTCMWSRAINLKLCRDLSVKDFLRAFQIHCLEYGLPEYCISDLGSQLVAGSNLIADYLKDPQSQHICNSRVLGP